MPVAFRRFEWEGVEDHSIGWQHTEYVIELRIDVAASENAAQDTESVPGPSCTIRRRYTDFFQCHTALRGSGLTDLPDLPPKEPLMQRMFGSFAARQEWQDQRRRGLQAYAGELLLRPELQAQPCVQKLLAFGPIPPEPPACVRVKPVRGACGMLEIMVRQAMDANSSGKSDDLPDAPEVLVVFREMGRAGDIISDGMAEGRAVAARVRLPVERPSEEIRSVVHLRPGNTYIVEAVSVSLLGLQSTPVTLITRVPEDAGQTLSPTQSLPDLHNDTEAGYTEAETELSEVCSSGEDDERGVHARRVTYPRKKPASMRLRQATFRGRAACEYANAAFAQAKRSYQSTPYRLVSATADQASSASAKAPSSRLTVQVELDGPEQLVTDTGASQEHTVHREVEVLDQERTEMQQQRLLEEARLVITWVAEVTEKAELHGVAEGDMADIREALLSGEVLCELANSCAVCCLSSTRAQKGRGPALIPSFYKGSCSKFKQMDNISKFIRACRDFFQIPEHQLFCTVDLAEGQGMQEVVRCILALEGRVNEMRGAG